MLHNYFKIAWRNILRGKGYSVLNILGLAVGMAVALLIGVWVYNEYSFDKFLPGCQQAYVVKKSVKTNGYISTVNSASLKLADALRERFPEIEYVAESDWMGAHGLIAGDKKLIMNGGHTGRDFLQIFNYPLLQGQRATVLKDLYSIVLTESAARALFGNADPMNKTVRFDNQHDLKVTGVLKDLPANSSFQFKFLVPFQYFEQTHNWVKYVHTLDFGNGNAFQIFVRLKPGIAYAQVAPKIKDIEKAGNSINAKNTDVIMEAMPDWHLYGNYENGKQKGGFIDYIRMFSIIGLLILAIACINFINLATARSLKRAREVGIRKVMGSHQKDLVIQFLAESLVLTVIAFVCSLLLVRLALPAFNAVTGKAVDIPFSNPYFWIVVPACVCLTALAAGSRPAFYLAAFNPAEVLKGTTKPGASGSLPRKILVVIQFSCSIALIICTIVVYRQVQYARERPKGYDANRLVMMDMTEDLGRNYTALKDELIRKGFAESVTQASASITSDGFQHNELNGWPGRQAGQSLQIGVLRVTPDYFKTLGMDLPEGRDFTSNTDTNAVIFNEAAIQRMGLKAPLGQTVVFMKNSYRIAGVVKNALMASPFAPPDPTMFMCTYEPEDVLMFRLSPRIKTQDANTQLAAIFSKYNPAYPFSYQFGDSAYASKFQLEVLVGKLAALFAGLAIFISCLGLFGLAAYVAGQRTKEIGIRKILGASVPRLWLLLSKDFILLIFISCLIASPIAFYSLQSWLSGYPYRISIGADVFILAVLISLIITTITISFQTIKASIANPVMNLRSE